MVSVKYANGNDINVSNHIGVINPIRYRGYYYDSETGFYYLKSRYYPDIQELAELEITELDNAFTWIWITLECNKCGTIYKNFVDFETT